VSDPFSKERIQAAYDAVAREYEAAFGDDLDRLPLDRRMLNRVRRTTERGLILDVGCGTGSAGSYLSKTGARVVGLDLSFGMLRSRRPGQEFPVCQGDMRCLPFADEAFAAVVAYYSVQHVARTEVGSVFAEMVRVLAHGGTLLLATHLGQGEVYTEEFLGHRIASAGGTLYSPLEIADRVSAAGLTIRTAETRGPLEHEHQSQRLYVMATRAE
jgi:hypothetical protein